METATNETTEQALATLPAETLESLWLAFQTLNALEFARHLHTLGIPDALKREFLCAKVNQKPRDQENLMQAAIGRAMDSFWSRLGAEKK
jgi:hypothetical protein